MTAGILTAFTRTAAPASDGMVSAGTLTAAGKVAGIAVPSFVPLQSYPAAEALVSSSQPSPEFSDAYSVFSYFSVADSRNSTLDLEKL